MAGSKKKFLALALAAALAVSSVPMAGLTDVNAAAKVKISKSTASIKQGKSFSLKLKNVSKKDAKKVKWTTSDKKVAKVTVKTGVKTTVKGVGEGTAVIKAKLGKKTYKCKVTVYGEQKLVFLRETYATYVGTAVGVRPAVEGDGTIDMSRLTYKSSDESVAKVVGTNGAIEGVAPGTATITITTDFGNQMEVTVKVFASKADADYANDFGEKVMQDRLAELKAAGITVGETDEFAGIYKQKKDRDKMVRAFSDPYLDAVNKNGGKTTYTDNTAEDDIACIRSVFDAESKNSTISSDLKAYLEPLVNAKTNAELAALNVQYISEGMNGLWKVKYVAVGDESAKVGMLLSSVPATLLDDASEYSDSTKYSYLKEYVKQCLIVSGETEEDAAKNADVVLKASKELTPVISVSELMTVTAGMTDAQAEKYIKKKGATLADFTPIDATVKDASKSYPNLKLGDAYKASGFEKSTYMTSQDTMSGAWEALDTFVKEGDTDTLREVIRFCYATNFVKYTESGYKAFKSYEAKKTGLLVMPTEADMKKDFDNLVIKTLCDDIGWETYKEYLTYLGEDKTKEELLKIIQKYMDEYSAQFNSCEWMSDKAKKGALEKMDKMKIVIYGPLDNHTYDLNVDLQTAGEGGTIISNMQKIAKNRITNLANISGKALEGEDLFWIGLVSEDYTPMSVNATYTPYANMFIVMCGIIGDETFKSGDEVYNIGRIGYAAGHEIGHGFDSEGSQYDAYGNEKDWMTKADHAAFNAKQQALVKATDQFSIFYNESSETIYYCDGELELAENMADLSSVEIAINLVRKMNDPEKMKRVIREMSLDWATPNFDPTKLVTDNHGPAGLRAVMPFLMFQEFYDVYGVKETDAMYIAPEKRVRLWS